MSAVSAIELRLQCEQLYLSILSVLEECQAAKRSIDPCCDLSMLSKTADAFEDLMRVKMIPALENGMVSRSDISHAYLVAQTLLSSFLTSFL